MRQRLKTLTKYWFIPLVVNIFAFGWTLANYYDVPLLAKSVRTIRCAFEDGLQNAAWSHEKFISQSGVSQTLEAAFNVKDEPSEEQGWHVFRPGNPAEPAVIRISLDALSDEAIFFPRVSGEDASVEVAAIKDGKSKPVFLLRGTPNEWTPVSAQFPLDLRCLGQDGKIALVIILRGRWAQLWNKNSIFFF